MKEKVTYIFDNRLESWIDKTDAISEIVPSLYYGNFTGYNVYFKSDKKKDYFYPINKIRVINVSKEIDFTDKDVFLDNELVYPKKIQMLENGQYRVICAKNIQTGRSLKMESARERKNLISYFKKLAEYTDKIFEEDEPIKILSRSYERFSLSNNSALFDVLNGTLKNKENIKPIIVPFSFNQSQYDAINRALTNNISIIEGPPGTGKTQTIINLLMNLVFRGKTCAVISNNNTAIDNIYEKLLSEELSFIVAPLGKRDNVKHFFENNSDLELESFLSQKPPEIPSNNENTLEELADLFRKIQEKKNENAKISNTISEIEVEEKRHGEKGKSNIRIKRKLASKQYLEIINILQKPKKLSYIKRTAISFKLGIKVAKTDITTLLYTLENKFYTQRITELKERKEKNERFLENNKNEEVEKSLGDLSKSILQRNLYIHYISRRKSSFDKDSYKTDYNAFLNRFPIVLSTAHSLLNNTPKGFSFDYLVIDEASQGDLLSSIIALGCAKNLVVVGDSRQLQEIGEESIFAEAERLAVELEIPEHFRYESNSILKTISKAINNCPRTLLKEHYRSAPDIIEFCNKRFYNNELIPMTTNSMQHIEIIKSVPGNHARKNPDGPGMYNQREIDEVIELIKKTGKDQDLGVITPFRNQADRIKRELKDTSAEIDTVHKFQGRQKDTIILSFVVNSLDKKEVETENRLYNFITDERLLNVAISRAKSKVIALISDGIYKSENNPISDFIKYSEYLYGKSFLKESKITSIFDVLYSESKQELIELYNQKTKKYKTEILFCNLLEECLREKGYLGFALNVRLSTIIKIPLELSDIERSYLSHPWTHVDFLIYNKVSKTPLFALEVDGVRYHEQSKNQDERDKIKDKAFSVNGVPLYRFKTNESNEKERLVKIIDGLS